MKNYIGPGDTLEFTAGADIASGAGVLVGGIFGVATGAVANGATGVLKLSGVFELPKAGSQAWTVGAVVYWDDTNKVCTTTASTHKRIGVAYEAVAGGAGDTLGRVRLNGASVN